MSLEGDMDMVRWLGDGVVRVDAVSEYAPPSERVRWMPLGGREASAAAVAAAASSTVPV